MNFDARKAFDFPPDAFSFSMGYLLGLGAAARIGIYDYLGYYDVCYIGEEVRDPGRNIPRSIIISLLGVALIYIGINLSLIGVISWRELIPVENNLKAEFAVSVFVERLLGSSAAKVFTLFVLWTAFASVFALMLGYSRIPYAAAQDGYFFKSFGVLHPTKNFPHRSLLVIGILSIGFSFLSLGAVIDALITSRILVQFVGQIWAVKLLRETKIPMPFRMWLYPLPCFVALAGWIFLLFTTKKELLLLTFEMMALGVVAFLVWSRVNRTWPFAGGGNNGSA
jgi:amino acid transporter